MRRVNSVNVLLFLVCYSAIAGDQGLSRPQLIIAADPLAKCCDEVCSISYNSDGTMLAAKLYHADFMGHSGVIVWNVSSGSLVKGIEGFPVGVYSIQFSPNGRAIASSDGQLIDVRNGNRWRWIEEEEKGHAIAISPNGKLIASSQGRIGPEIKLWDSASGSQVRVFRSGAPSGKELWFSRDGSTLMSTGRDFVQFWSVNTGELIRTMKPDCGTFSRVAYSEKKNLLAVTECGSSDDYVIRLYDAETGQPTKELPGHKSAIWDIAFSPDGELLASSAEELKVWDVSNSTLLRTFIGHSRVVRSIAFSPNARTLASGGTDNETAIWSIKSGKLIATLRAFKDGNWIVFTPDGYYQCSDGASKYIQWMVGGRLYREIAFRKQFFKPHLIEGRLGRE